MRKQIIATLAVTGALIVGIAVPSAQAAKAKENDAAQWCSSGVRTSCVLYADAGALVVRNKKGKVYGFTDEAHAVKYLRRHVRPCLDEGYPSCFRNAADFGSGPSYLDIAGTHRFDLSSLHLG